MLWSHRFPHGVDAVRKPIGSDFTVLVGNNSEHIANLIRHSELSTGQPFARQSIRLDDPDPALGLRIGCMKLSHSIRLHNGFQHNQLAGVALRQGVLLDDVGASVEVITDGNTLFISCHGVDQGITLEDVKFHALDGSTGLTVLLGQTDGTLGRIVLHLKGVCDAVFVGFHHGNIAAIYIVVGSFGFGDSVYTISQPIGFCDTISIGGHSSHMITRCISNGELRTRNSLVRQAVSLYDLDLAGAGCVGCNQLTGFIGCDYSFQLN